MGYQCAAEVNCRNKDFVAEGSWVARFGDVAVAWRWTAETAMMVAWTHFLGKAVGEEAECMVMIEMARRTVTGYLGVAAEELIVAECEEFVAAVAEAALVDFVAKSLAEALCGKNPSVEY